MKISKKKVKIVIISYAFLRLIQACWHLIVCYFTRKRFFSSATAFSISIAFCAFWFMSGAICERVVLLETGIVWMILKFIAIVFQVMNVDFENDSFFSNSLGLNLTISTSKSKYEFIQQFLISSWITVLDLIALAFVLKLRVILIEYEVEFVSEIEDKQLSPVENHDGQRDAVAFEPFLFTMMLDH